ncbi:MAG: hypothetical protein KDA79_24060, partial [Planctomycetaceae bacterium]|nr:hypothetical protein [Planctomycetaceae bacterium]
MPRQFVLTLTAASRVGILAAVTKALDELGGNLHAMDQTVLQGYFTMILSADFPEHRDPQVVIDHIRDIGRPWGIDVTLKDPEADQLSDTGEDTWICAVEFFGPDRPGLLRQMASRFALEGISIIELHGRRNEEDDEVNMKLELAVPDSCSPDVVYNFIQDLQESTQLQTRIHPV